MQELYLHAVLIRRRRDDEEVSLGIARRKAQEWICNRNRRFYREIDEWFMFRNLPKKHFDKVLISPYDDDTMLVYGRLKENDKIE